MVTDTLVRKILLSLFLLIRVALIVGLVSQHAFDASYYTYINLSFVTLLLAIGLAGLWVPPLMRFYARYLFPLALQSTLLVAFLIVIIVQLNPEIFESHALPYGGTMTLGDLHTGDFAVHFFPAIDMLVTFLAIHHLVRFHVRTLWFDDLAEEPWLRALYAGYVLLGAMVPFGLYGVIFDSSSKYPVPLPGWANWGIVVLLCALVGLLNLAFFLSTHDLRFGAPLFGAEAIGGGSLGVVQRRLESEYGGHSMYLGVGSVAGAVTQNRAKKAVRGELRFP